MENQPKQPKGKHPSGYKRRQPVTSTLEAWPNYPDSPRKNGVPRVATIKTASGEIKRGFQKICPFPEG